MKTHNTTKTYRADPVKVSHFCGAIAKVFLLLVLLATGLVGSSAEADISVPFDYFYGRWAPGHYGSLQYSFQNHNEPHGTANYRYRSDKYSWGLSNMRGKVLFYDEDDNLRWPTGWVSVRPSNNWQVDLNVNFNASKSLQLPTGDPLRMESSSGHNVSLNVSSRWINKDSVTVSDVDAPYFYYVDELVGNGVSQMETSFSARRSGSNISESQSTQDENGSPRLKSSTSTNDTHQLAFNNSLRWGMFKNLEVKVSGNRTWHWFDGSYQYWLDGSYRPVWVSGDHGTSQTLQTSSVREAEVGLTWSQFAPVYVSAGAKRVASERSQDVYSLDYMDDPPSVTYQEDTQDLELTQQTRSFNLGASYVGRGEFDPSIIKDDYSDFYHNMLFRRQLIVKAAFSHEELEQPDQDDSRRSQLKINPRLGLSNRMELGMTWRYYSSNSRGQYRVSTSADIVLKYRSFEYEKGEGQGWDRDDAHDIAFGPVPQAGQFYISASYSSPNYSRTSDESLGFFTFGDLQNQYYSSLSLQVRAGLGRGVVFTALNTEQYYHSSINTRSFRATLSGRVLKNAELSLNYDQSYNSLFDQVFGDGGTSDPRVSARIRVLL